MSFLSSSLTGESVIWTGKIFEQTNLKQLIHFPGKIEAKHQQQQQITLNETKVFVVMMMVVKNEKPMTTARILLNERNSSVLTQRCDSCFDFFSGDRQIFNQSIGFFLLFRASNSETKNQIRNNHYDEWFRQPETREKTNQNASTFDFIDFF